MKKYLMLCICLLLLVGCDKKEEEKPKEKVLATGELLCVYKEQRTNINTMYTSSYQYNYNKNGILESAINREKLEFNDASSETKEYYEEMIKEANKDYDNIKGVKSEITLEEDKYSLTVTMDIKDMDDETKEKYLVNIDRITAYNLFTDMGYTCE